MISNWDLIRKVMTATINACENVERLNVTEIDRDRIGEAGGVRASVYDALQSAWIYPENLQGTLLRARHVLGQNSPYTNELSHALVNAARVCAELIGAVDTRTPVSGVDPHAGARSESIEQMVNRLCAWYDGHFAAILASAMTAKAP